MCGMYVGGPYANPCYDNATPVSYTTCAIGMIGIGSEGPSLYMHGTPSSPVFFDSEMRVGAPKTSRRTTRRRRKVMVGEKLDGMGMGEYMFGRTLPRLTFVLSLLPLHSLRTRPTKV